MQVCKKLISWELEKIRKSLCILDIIVQTLQFHLILLFLLATTFSTYTVQVSNPHPSLHQESIVISLCKIQQFWYACLSMNI